MLSKRSKIVLLSIILMSSFMIFSCKKSEEKPTPISEVEPKVDRPINLQATKGNFGNSIVVTWTPLPTAKNYQLFRYSESLDKYEMVQEGADTLYNDVTVYEPYKKVFYKVKVVNSTTEVSDFSDVNYGYTSGRNFSSYFSFGSEGSGQGQFQYAMHVAVDPENNIYVSDDGDNNRVQKFDSKGNFKEVFFEGYAARSVAFLKNGNTVVTRVQNGSYVLILDPQKKVVKQWGNYGSGDAQFQNIEEITVDEDDNIYIVDGQNNAVKKFDKNGNFLLKFTAATKVSGQIDGPYPYGICYYNEKLFVTSTRNHEVRVYDKQGKFIKVWDAGSNCFAIKAFKTHLYINCDNHVLKTDGSGEVREKIAEGQFFNQITGLAVNSDEEIIVSDIYARVIRVFKRL